MLKAFFIRFAIFWVALEICGALVTIVLPPATKNFNIEPKSHFETIIHPFFGYVQNPLKPKNELNFKKLVHVSDLGLKCGGQAVCISPGLQAAKGSQPFELAIFGGSVATQMCDYVASMDTKIHFFCGAIEGGKQPQQLSILAYMYASGYTFENVVTIDGINEAGDGIRANFNYQTHPSYPFGWHERINSITGLGQSGFANYYISLWIKNKLEGVSENPSFAISGIARLISRILQKNINSSNFNTYDSSPIPGDRWRHGPPMPHKKELYEEVGLLYWAQSNETMRKLTNASGGKFLNVLQPTQFFVNSKASFTEFEETVVLPNKTNEQIFLRMFPRFKETALNLHPNDFLDLSEVFSKTHRQVFIDSAAHLTTLGQQILFDRIARHLDLYSPSSKDE